MFIRYYSTIEQPRVYGFLLHFYCIPTASTILMKKMSLMPTSQSEDCFIEDNTILQDYSKSQKFRPWRIPGSADRHYKKMQDSGLDINKLPHAEALKKSRLEAQSFNTMEMYIHFDKNSTLKNDLFLKRNRRPGSLSELKQNHKYFYLRNETNYLHQILSMHATKNLFQDINTKSRRNSRKISSSKSNSIYPRNVVKMAMDKTTPTTKILYHEDFTNVPKGHEHQEMLQPRPDLTIMVQPSKIDYAGWQNNGGIRFFIHRTYTVPLDPRDSIEIDNNVETFINLEHEDVDWTRYLENFRETWVAYETSLQGICGTIWKWNMPNGGVILGTLASMNGKLKRC